MRIAVVVPVLAILAAPVPALAQEPSADAILCQLDPSCAKPGTDPGAKAAPEGRRLRSIDPAGAAPQPSQNAVNLNIPFEFNSAILQTDARITLDNLGKALSNPRLAGYVFLIGGHTDAKGSANYNRVLSERRAEAVRRYLMSHYNIPASKLTAKGFGSVQLLDPEHPLDGVNRRVQIVNMTTPTTSR